MSLNNLNNTDHEALENSYKDFYAFDKKGGAVIDLVDELTWTQNTASEVCDFYEAMYTVTTKGVFLLWDDSYVESEVLGIGTMVMHGWDVEEIPWKLNVRVGFTDYPVSDEDVRVLFAEVKTRCSVELVTDNPEHGSLMNDPFMAGLVNFSAKYTIPSDVDDWTTDDYFLLEEIHRYNFPDWVQSEIESELAMLRRIQDDSPQSRANRADIYASDLWLDEELIEK